jgi:thioredoxin reductase (NADPH)
MLRRVGVEQDVAAGDVLYRQEDRGFDFFIVLAGRIAIVDDYQGPRERLVVEHGPRGFLGEWGLLADKSRQVYLVARRDDLGETMSRYLIDEIARHRRIEVLTQTEAVELHGRGGLDGLTIADRTDGSRRRLDVRALFVFIGADPHTEWLNDVVALDDSGFILTGRDVPGDAGQDGQRLPLETSLPGVFAVGDVRCGSIKRVASAVGEGSMAVRLVHDYLAHR